MPAVIEDPSMRSSYERSGTPPWSRSEPRPDRGPNGAPPARGLPSRGPSPRELPLWLTAEEAELLISLCLAAPAGAGGACAADVEERLFNKLGELFRAF